MKYYKILLLSLLYSVSIKADPVNCRIDFFVSGLESKKIVLAYEYGYKQLVVDTIRLDNAGKGFYASKNRLIGGIYLLIFPDKNKYFEFLINEEQFFTINSDTSDFFGKMEIEGSDESELFRQYQVLIKEFETAEKNTLPKNNYKDTLNTKTYSQGNPGIAELQKKIDDFKSSAIKEKPQSFLAAYFKMQNEPSLPEQVIGQSHDPNRDFFLKRYQYLKKHYLDNIPFADNRILRTKLIYEKLEFYFNRLISQDPDSLKAAVDFVTTLANVKDEPYQFVLNFLYFNYRNPKNPGQECAFVYLADKYLLIKKAKWADTIFLKLLKLKVDAFRPSLPGNIAPDLELQTMDEKTINIHSINSDFLCLYFWSPDCDICKEGIQKLYETYNKLKSIGLQVVAIYIHADKTIWMNYLSEKKYNWINAYDPLLKSNFTKLYDIRTVPSLYLLDKNKKIIAKKINVSQIEKYINQ